MCVLATITLLSFPAIAQGGDIDAEYDRAIASARAGDTESALRLLSALISEHPTVDRYRYDYVTVLGWAGQDSVAFAQRLELDLSIAPIYVLESLAKSARNIQDFTAAEALYRRVLERNAGRVQSRAGLAMSLADALRGPEAFIELDSIGQDDKENPDIVAARIYVEDSMRDPIDAALAKELAVKAGLLPVTALRKYILDISRRGAPQMALAMAERNDGAMTVQDIAQIKNDEAVAHVRWGRFDSLTPADRYHHTDVAIKLLGNELAKLTNDGSYQVRRMNFDLLVAYRDRQNLSGVIEVYESLVEQGVEFPPYVLHAVGDVYLALKKPELAEALIRQSLLVDSHNLDAKISLFYALLDLRQYREALAYIDTVAADQPAWITSPSGGQRVWNTRKTQLDVTASLARAFVGYLPESQLRLEALLASFTNNLDIKNELANVYLWRGWPRLALSTFSAIKTMEPDFLPATLGEISVAYALGDASAAESLLARIPAAYSADGGVLRRQRELKIYRMREVSIQASGGQVVSFHDGSSDLSIDGRYYDAYVMPSWRPFAHVRYQQGNLLGSLIEYHQLGVGVNYGVRNISGNLELTQDSNQSIGLRVDGRWALSDYVSVSASLDSNSRDTPLRARSTGIKSASSEVGLRYRFDETRAMNVGLGIQQFDDRNRRLSYYLSGRQALVTRPKYSLAMGVFLYQQRNRAVDSDYFNPTKISSSEISLTHEWRNYRRYDDGFSQRLRTYLGSVSQQQFSPGFVWGVGYEHVWDLGELCSLTYGLSYGRTLYDGVFEKPVRGFFTLNKRF